jgi:multicomponent Na+:H+ antiporter subunit E
MNHATWVPSIVLRSAFFAGLWWVLQGGDSNGWVIPVLVVLTAVAASLVLLPPRAWRLRPVKALRLLAFFLGFSVMGGMDVAKRALDPRLPVQPGMLVHRFRLQGTGARHLMMAMVSLLPGTLSVDVEEDVLHVHALSLDLPVQRTLQRLEERIAALYE